MTEHMADSSPRPGARLTGAVYLAYFLTAICAGLLMKGLVVSGDAAATAHNLRAHEPLFRAGMAVGLVATALYIAVTALFYELFKPVSRSLSLLAAFFSLLGCAVQAGGNLFLLAPLIVLGGGQSLSVFNVEQLQALALLFLKLRVQGMNIELVLFAFYDLLIGTLIFRSAFLPSVLGVLMALAGLGWLSALYPPLAAALSPSIEILGFLAEVALMLWLLVRGVNVPRWREQFSATGEGRT